MIKGKQGEKEQPPVSEISSTTLGYVHIHLYRLQVTYQLYSKQTKEEVLFLLYNAGCSVLALNHHFSSYQTHFTLLQLDAVFFSNKT